MELLNYKHKIVEVVRFHEVDLLAVCNNAVYFNYFEDARLKYVKDLRAQFNFKEFLEGNSFFIMANNHADYLESARLDDELYIYTRINFVKNSSFGFKHLVQNLNTKKILCRGGGVVVHIDKTNNKPLALPQEFYDAVIKFEPAVEIIRNI